ncbi:uncharacterized protein LOC128678049 [Plodia interpunctella]|uniref:uncharacterized protein LOC128678049 n=1 Tax=Plodia interpunctella TaxID=58824 RepID=UPI002368C5FD|nr:uncharacterized protein LOC128678049 [Plodia interpunctella]
MSTKSPTTSVKSREMIGVDQFSQRREVFDKHDTVFLPLPSPTAVAPVYRQVEPIITSNHGKTTSNFKRNIAASSSMRESKTDERIFDFRPRKYSDNFTSELNQSDDVDYRYSSTERTRRLSKLRRDFLASNLHDPSEHTFTRSGTRASMPVNSTPPIRYKIESPNLYKFPFAEPYATPPPVRRVVVDLGPSEVDGKENQDPELRTKYQSLPNNNASPTTKIDHQKLFEELVKRYSPQRKPVDWTLPPTRPRVVGSVPKSTSSIGDTLDLVQKTQNDEKSNKDDDVFEKKEENNIANNNIQVYRSEAPKPATEVEVVVIQNGPTSGTEGDDQNEKSNSESKASVTELAEKNDRVPELPPIQRQLSKDSKKKQPPPEKHPDLTIPALIDKITTEGETLENNIKKTKKVKRKRSFLDKLLGRKKDK